MNFSISSNNTFEWIFLPCIARIHHQCGSLRVFQLLRRNMFILLHQPLRSQALAVFPKLSVNVSQRFVSGCQTPDVLRLREIHLFVTEKFFCAVLISVRSQKRARTSFLSHKRLETSGNPAMIQSWAHTVTSGEVFSGSNWVLPFVGGMTV